MFYARSLPSSLLFFFILESGLAYVELPAYDELPMLKRKA